MTNRTNVDLPDSIRQMLPEEVQEVYRKAYAASWDTYSPLVQRTLNQGSIAHRDAWEAVLREFEQDPDTGQWHRRGEKSVEEPERGTLLDRIRSALKREIWGCGMDGLLPRLSSTLRFVPQVVRDHRRV